MKPIFAVSPASRRNRQRHTVNGTINAVRSETTGFWIFKSTRCWLEVTLDSGDLAKLNFASATASQGLSHPAYAHRNISENIKIGVPESEFTDYANVEGSSIILIFGVARSVDQFFGGQDACIIMDAEFDPRVHQLA